MITDLFLLILMSLLNVSIVKNLAIILGKEKLIELTGKQKIVFIKSDDKAGMEEVLLP